MPIVTGLVLDGYRSLPEVCSPLATELARCFWVVDAQSGPFRSSWMFESEQNEALAEGQFWDVPPLADTSATGLRPGTIPRLADRLVVEEWSYYIAMDAPEPQALVRACDLAKDFRGLTESFLRDLHRYADLLICHIDGWWEFYCARPDWIHRLLSAWPDCYERAVSEAGKGPLRTM